MKRYFILMMCLFISACYFNLLQFPNKIVTGGIAGLSIIINDFFNIPPANIIMFISVSLLVIGFFILGIKKVSGAIISSIIYPIFIDITKNINYLFKLNISNMLVISIILGILFGITTGLVYKVGFSNGGLSILSEIISKYTRFSLSDSIFIINSIIVLIGSFSIGFEKLIYALIILIINSLIIKCILKNEN